MAQQRQPIFLKISDGGLGFGSTVLRGEAAFVGAWEGSLGAAAATVGVESLAAFKLAWPAWADAIERADRGLRVSTGAPMPEARWADCVGSPAAKKQRDYTQAAVKARTEHLLSGMSPHEADKVQQAAGKGAGQFMVP